MPCRIRKGLAQKKDRFHDGSGLFIEVDSIGSVSGGQGGSDDVHAAAFLVEEHAAIDESEERVVTTATDAKARMHFGAALADDDVSGDHGLAAEFFHAEALAAGIATVLDGTLSFFMGHKSGEMKWLEISRRSR
jgi:hypothetical protein